MSIPRISSRTPLKDRLLPLHTPNEKLYQPLIFLPVAAVSHLRKARQQAYLLALLSLILLTAYVFLLRRHDTGSSLVLREPDSTRPSPSQLSLALESIRNSGVDFKPRPKKTAEQIRLTDAQELAAVSSFLASLPSQNQIPSFVDPSSPIDPQLVLDFDTRGPRASKEVVAMVEDVWSRNPVFLYSKVSGLPKGTRRTTELSNFRNQHYSAASREVKMILDNFNLKPTPTIIDVDVRDDADVLIPMLHRLTSIHEFPILIVAGRLVGTLEDVRQMNNNGTLRQMIAQSGARIEGARRRKHRH
ncbi:hypothetical protein D9756_007654 [Leucocoprinus leucothites]|uniref:Uncharacterized protein n=1 Tax=Leucocoprinus leucothites TaxID=201217 RepID=A0A8H5FWU4_9AGAR|nr:hypothetical protein D9756_007654 [Leucoagaricus leucothites]